MPPSPALRCSPAWEQRMENTHKRGHSFEGGLTLNARDDDLALFNEMQNKERDTFLLHSSDDVDDSLSKLRCFSDIKLGITIPARRDSSDLLNADTDKGDYDWLLTPPDTPLFPFLDDEEPEAPKQLPRGRARSLPINISRSSYLSERAQRSCRSSASPHRLSPSPRSSNNIRQLQSRSLSTPRSSTPPVLRPATPTRRPSTTPNKLSSPISTARSSTPMARRMSTGSSGEASSSGRRGTSPMRATRGNSASPKLQGWQSILPGFSSDAPPNLRTSPSDRAPPLVRGLSPPTRSGKGRQSMSPIASRRPSSSHSNERDRFSSCSKGSVVSSGDDDVDFLNSVSVSSSPPARINAMPVNSRPVAFSKKPSRTSPSNSAPKRSFESIPRKMENRKTPQNMFRPLLSSVPAATFYGGRSNTYKPMFSINSSLTTSTSGSSDHGASVAPDMERDEHDRNDLAGEWERTQEMDSLEEVFSFDKVDVIEDRDHELYAKKPLGGSESFSECIANKVDSHECQGPTINFGVSNTEAAAVSINTAGNLSVIDGCQIMVICSICGKCFRPLGVNGKMDVCEECTEINELVAVEPLLPHNLVHDQTLKSEMVNEMDTSASELQTVITGSHGTITSEVRLGQHEHSGKHEFNCLDNCFPLQSFTDQSECHVSAEKIESLCAEASSECDSRSEFEQTEPLADPSLRVDNPEGAGISVLLLQRESSNKWPLVQAKVLSAAIIHCSEPSYVKDNSIAMKQSIGRDGALASSSIDLGSSRQVELHIQRQFSSRKNEMDSVRTDSETKSQCTGSHSDLTISTSGPLVHHNIHIEENFSSFVDGMEDGASHEPDLVLGDCNVSFDPLDMGAKSSACRRAVFVSGDLHDCGDSSVQNTFDLQLSHEERTHYEMSTADNLKDEDHILCANVDEDAVRESTYGEAVHNSIPYSSIIAEGLNGPSCRSDISDAATNSYSIATLESKTDCDSIVEAFHEPSVSMTSEKGLSASSLESGPSVHTHGAHEESSVTVEVAKGRMSRSFTLAEATDTILFCSSIIHDIAYKAAAIAMENELAAPLEPLQPTTTISGKSDRGQDSKKMSNKRTPRSQKFKRKGLEMQTKSPLRESGNNVIVQESTPLVGAEKIQSKSVDSAKPLKLESKCNCTVM